MNGAFVGTELSLALLVCMTMVCAYFCIPSRGSGFEVPYSVSSSLSTCSVFSSYNKPASPKNSAASRLGSCKHAMSAQLIVATAGRNGAVAKRRCSAVLSLDLGRIGTQYKEQHVAQPAACLLAVNPTLSTCGANQLCLLCRIPKRQALSDSHCVKHLSEATQVAGS